MPQTYKQGSTNIRSEAKTFYRDKHNVTRKWLDQYGNVSLGGNYQRNRACVSEVFNMLDIVMENCIDDFRRTHAILSISTNRGIPRYTFAADDGSKIIFDKPSTFAKRTAALRAIGYDISDDLAYDTRILRNETTHGNQTVILKHMELGYDETIAALHSIADTLITLGMLDPAYRSPDFEMMRVHEGDTLQNGTYTIGSLIGEGGMSRVYEATQVRLGRRLAVKELKPGSYSEELIRHECETLMRLRHAQIPQIHDTFYENSTYYIVMSYVEGATLDEYIANKELTNEDRRSIAKGLCQVLSYLHSEEVGLVFVDLAPDNIIIDSDQVPHLIDFGISNKKDTRQSIPAATVDYAAPEVLAGKALDERSDIYAFGYILRYIYTGLTPAEKKDIPTAKLVSDPTVAEIINRCTARNPKERFESIAALSKVYFPELSITDNSGVETKKHRFHIAAITAGLCLAIGAAALAVWKSYSKEKTPVTVETQAVTIDEVGEKMWAELGIEDHDMVWSDDALEQAIREFMVITMNNEKYKTGPISRRDLFISLKNNSYRLDLSKKDIENISDLCELVEIENLDLSNNNISDISALSSMTGLKVLVLQNVLVSDLSPLADLQLDRLYLGNTKFDFETDHADYSVLGIISSLKELYIRNAGFTSQDLQGLASLEKLTVLEIPGNDVCDISMLTKLTALTTLNLEGCKIEDFSPLSKLSNLIFLDLSDTGLSDISFLQDLPKLSLLSLCNNPILDYSPIKYLTELNYLDLSYTGLSDNDMEWISELTQLDYLDLTYNDLHTIDFFQRLDHYPSSLFIKEGNPGITDYSTLDGISFKDTDINKGIHE